MEISSNPFLNKEAFDKYIEEHLDNTAKGAKEGLSKGIDDCVPASRESSIDPTSKATGTLVGLAAKTNPKTAPVAPLLGSIAEVGTKAILETSASSVEHVGKPIGNASIEASSWGTEKLAKIVIKPWLHAESKNEGEKV